MQTLWNDLDGVRIHVLGNQRRADACCDLHTLVDALQGAGASVTLTARDDDTRQVGRTTAMRLLRRADAARGESDDLRYDVGIMVECLQSAWTAVARHNLFLPHLKWPVSRAGQLQGVDGVLCQTHHHCNGLSQNGYPSRYVGWAGHDRHLPDVPRQRAFFHHAGGEGTLETQGLLALWRKHPDWPALTVVRDGDITLESEPMGNVHYIEGEVDDARLRRMQNEHLFHLCLAPPATNRRPLGAAQSVGAVIVGVPGGTGEPADASHPGGGRFVEVALEGAVERVMAMGDTRIVQLGEQARARYEENDRRFRSELPRSVRQLCRLYQQQPPASRDHPAAASA